MLDSTPFREASPCVVISLLCAPIADSQGLPPQWSKLLTSSAITQEEAARHPEAVLDVLQFYTQQQMGQSGGDYQPPPLPSLPSQSRTAGAAASRFEGVGLAGQQTSNSQQRLQQSQVQDQRNRDRDRERDLLRQRERVKDAERLRESQRQIGGTAPLAPSRHAPRSSDDEANMSARKPAEPRPLMAERKAPQPPRPSGPTTGQSNAQLTGLNHAQTPQPAGRAVQQVDATPQAPIQSTQRPERRISTMNEAQILEKLRSVVSQDDPTQLYSKIKKVGQG